MVSALKNGSKLSSAIGKQALYKNKICEVTKVGFNTVSLRAFGFGNQEFHQVPSTDVMFLDKAFTL